MWCYETKVQTLLRRAYVRHPGRSTYTLQDLTSGRRSSCVDERIIHPTDYCWPHRLCPPAHSSTGLGDVNWQRKIKPNKGLSIRILLFLSRLTHIIARWGKGLWAVIKVSNVGITSAPTLTTETQQPRTGKNLFRITQFFELLFNFKPHFITTRKEMIYWSLIMEANKWYFTCYKIHQ